MLQRLHLRNDSLLPNFVGIAETVDGDTGAQVKLTFSGFVIGDGALSSDNFKRETCKMCIRDSY